MASTTISYSGGRVTVISTGGAGGGVTDHGALTGLNDDDHPQYLLADGSRALSGNLALGDNVTIDGRDPSADGETLDEHIAATSGAHPADAISYDPGEGPLSATDAQGALDEAGAALVDLYATRPSSGQKDALAGTNGTPGTGNRYVTDADSRNTNARTPTAHASSHLPGGTDAIPPSTPVTEAGTTRALSDADHGRVILFTHASGCAVEVPGTLTPGFTCLLVQRGGQITATGSNGLTMTPPASFVAKTAEAGSAMAILVESATVGNVIGDLEAAP